MNLRIVALLDEKGNELAKYFSQQINSELQSHFTLDTNNIPHITLLHIHIPERNLSAVRQLLSNVASSISMFTIRTRGIMFDPDNKTYIWIYFEDDKQIILLRNLLLEQIEPISDEVSSFRQPHVTLTRMVNAVHSDKVLSSISDLPHENILISKIAICETGENGVCTNVVKEFDLNT